MTEASVALWRKSCRNYAGVFMLDSVVIFVSGDDIDKDACTYKKMD